MMLSAPSGWTVQATTPSRFATVAPGQTLRITWQVAASATTRLGKFAVSAQATFTSVNGSGNSNDLAVLILHAHLRHRHRLTPRSAERSAA